MYQPSYAAVVKSFENDLKRLVRLSTMLSISGEAIEANDETPGFVASASITLRKDAENLIKALKKWHPESGAAIEAEMQSESLADRLELFDELADVVNLRGVLASIRVSKKEVKERIYNHSLNKNTNQ